MMSSSRMWQIDARYMQFMALRAAGLSPDAVDDWVTNQVAEWLEMDPKPLDYTEDGIAIVTISGPLYKRKSPFASNYRSISEALETLIANPPRAAVLMIDSPGGMVDGLAGVVELANRLSELCLTVAFVNGCCCSAAYRIACQAGSVVATSDSDIGSIGTYWQLIDYSKMFEESGLRSVLLTTGPFKGVGAIGEQITEDQQAFLLANVQETNLTMLADIVSGRGFSEEQITAVSDGRFWLAETALKLNLIDQIGTLADVMSTVRSQTQKEPEMAKPTLRPVTSQTAESQESLQSTGTTIADEQTTVVEATTTQGETAADAIDNCLVEIQVSLGSYMEAFGDAEGARMYRDGKPWGEAALSCINDLRGQNQDLKAENAALQSRVAELAKAVGGEAAALNLPQKGPKASLFKRD